LSTKIEGEQLSLPIRGPEHTKDEKDNTSTVAGSRNLRPAEQPRTMTGGTMRPYQLQGLSWLKSLFENGLNGILADEMGLGKTIQTIALLAFLREMGIFGPFLVVAPLSTLGNWIDEFSLWAPSIPKVLYHGTPNQRKELRERCLSISDRSDQFPVVCTSYEICINDQKFLNKCKWKYLIIVSIQAFSILPLLRPS
jgi:ATP-dependent DNA helicase